MKKQIHLNENELNRLIKESIKKVLKENEGGTGVVQISITSDDSSIEMYGNVNDCMAISELIGDTDMNIYINDRLYN